MPTTNVAATECSTQTAMLVFAAYVGARSSDVSTTAIPTVRR
jgi:hypothetical protein